jgi:sugar phosphate isomerase/epimerase
MRVGVDARHVPAGVKDQGAAAVLDHVRDLGLDGVFFRTLFDVSPSLDGGELRSVRDHARDLGLYFEAGLGKVNPFATAETPQLRQAGDGDIVLGIRRAVETAAALGLHDLWVGTANYKAEYVGKRGFDRFRTDVDWSQQLAAITAFLTTLAPMLRDHEMHLNLETHEEITSFEVVRIIEAVGPDVLGVVFDTANVLHRVEHPARAAARLAPYVRQTHLKDAALRWGPDGIHYQLRPCGRGVVDFEIILRILWDANPALNRSLECDDARRPGEPPLEMLIEIHDPQFLAAHPDLAVTELSSYTRMVRDYEEQTRAGLRPTFEAYAAAPFGLSEWNRYAVESAAHIRSVGEAVVDAAARRAPELTQSS